MCESGCIHKNASWQRKAAGSVLNAGWVSGCVQLFQNQSSQRVLLPSFSPSYLLGCEGQQRQAVRGGQGGTRLSLHISTHKQSQQAMSKQCSAGTAISRLPPHAHTTLFIHHCVTTLTPPPKHTRTIQTHTHTHLCEPVDSRIHVLASDLGVTRTHSCWWGWLFVGRDADIQREGERERDRGGGRDSTRNVESGRGTGETDAHVTLVVASKFNDNSNQPHSDTIIYPPFSCASLTMLARSAPTRPGRSLASCSRSTSGDTDLLAS